MESSHKRRTDLMRTTFAETLSKYDLFTKATQVYLYQRTGLFCVVNITELPFNSPTRLTRVLFRVSAGALFILPFYGDQGGGYALEYRLFRDDVFQHKYQYEFREKGFYWLPTLPFMWVSLLTTGAEEVFRGATQQFLLDAERDGYF